MMRVAFLIIGIIYSFNWTCKYTGANPTVTLTASSSPYFDIGGSLSFTCAISEDVNIFVVHLFRNDIDNPTIVININDCSFSKVASRDSHSYNITCEQRMTVYIVMSVTVATDDNLTWRCQMGASSGVCYSPCISTSTVTIVQRVPVSSVQLTDGTGQPLVTPVPVLDGSNKDFRCDTSPNGSRPRALIKWYIRSENQSPVLIQDQSVSTPGPKPEYVLFINTSYSTLTLMGNKSYQNMYIYCEARDETNRGNFSRSREAQLNIVYGPGNSIYLTPDVSVYRVEEGQKAVDVICRATCNPECSYRWLNGNVQINSGSTLSLGIVQKSATGNYICEAFNTIQGQMKGSNKSVEVIVISSTSNSPGVEVAGIAGGISAGLLVILVVGMGIFFWRRYKRQTDSDNDVQMEKEERHDAVSGQEYGEVHLTEDESSHYLEINDLMLEENRNANISSVRHDAANGEEYEGLHLTGVESRPYSELNDS